MKNIKIASFIILWILILINPVFADKKYITTNYNPAPHPRLFLLKDEEEDLKKSIAKDKLKMKIHSAILKEADSMLLRPTLIRKLNGKRLLGKSRELLRRTFYLSYAYRMTKNIVYAQKAEQEMLAVAEFSDWNPKHFLDVAEMTAGMAIGYDWTYDMLGDTSKARISRAIKFLGLYPSSDESKMNWLKATNNWNQVCNAGLTLGALATFENDKILACDIINRSINTIKLSMEEYGPDGGYSEGFMYWGYGTTFNAMYLSAIEKAFGTDYELSKTPGFLASGKYMVHMVGPVNQVFNFSDCEPPVQNAMNSPLFWMAEKNNDRGLIYNEVKFIERVDEKILVKDRVLPLALLWSKSLDFSSVPSPNSTTWVGQGLTPVALMRTSWSDPNAFFFGFKGGSPSTSHGHMDIGSFVIDALGERWAIDLGMEQYNNLELNKVDLWNMTQNSQRWQMLRWNNYHHNTLSVDSALQNVSGRAIITDVSLNPDNLSASSDLTTLYSPALSDVKRTISIEKKQKAVIRDEVKNSNKNSKVKFTILTPANVKILSDSKIELLINKKKMLLELDFKGKAKSFLRMPIPTNSFENKNDGVSVIGFDLELLPNQKTEWSVSFIHVIEK